MNILTWEYAPAICQRSGSTLHAHRLTRSPSPRKATRESKGPVTRYRITLVPDYFSHRLSVSVTRDHGNPIGANRGKITPLRM